MGVLTFAPRYVPIILPLALAALVFALDLLVPLGWAEWLPYLALMLFPFWLRERHSALILAAVCTVLIVLGFIFNLVYLPLPESVKAAIFRRGLGILVLWIIAVLVLSRQHSESERAKLILQLQQAFADVNTLRGLLPICASCKKIRDDKGSWSHMESYIQKHSFAESSHSLCPACADEFVSKAKTASISNPPPHTDFKQKFLLRLYGRAEHCPPHRAAALDRTTRPAFLRAVRSLSPAQCPKVELRPAVGFRASATA